MNVNAELALTAARVRILTETLPESARPDVASEWAALLDQIDDCRSNTERIKTIREWRQEFQSQIRDGRSAEPDQFEKAG
jgi:hypothetical protein